MKLISAAILLWAVSGAVAGTVQCSKECKDLGQPYESQVKNCVKKCDNDYKDKKNSCDKCKKCCYDCNYVCCDKAPGQELKKCKDELDECHKKKW
ncbi:hypothetical protein H2201_008715 [Coniosporium apollinis]|uniref:Uncharacterized protein n=2 Tax=Coniosporium TaxID=2810619 RepID=A0ABQ9NHE8_9PEZI|nr:hypothetical protein H2199_006604 [Cladosporium sp. JES 115]KAJ9655820.1 hypothetical protein H2201_008715 [Coniosporium apollinis]